MAVNLRATATLNTKPFVAGIRSIKAATESLNKSAIKGSTAVTTGVLAEKAAREANSKAVRQGQEAVTKGTGAVTKAMRQGTVDAKAHRSALTEIYAEHGRLINSLGKMTAAQQAQYRAVQRYNAAASAQAAALASGLEGPAYDRLAANTAAAADRVTSANRRVAAEAEKASTAARKAAEAQNLRNAATTKGIEDAKAYAQGLSGLTNEKLKLQAASERLGAAEARLASAMANSNGVITPAVRQARAGVISATAAYNSLAEAQANIGKAGSQAASGLAAQRYLYHDVSRQAAGAAVALAAIPAAAIGVGAVWENQFANVIRTSDDTLRTAPNRIDALRTSLVGMAKDMPTSFGNITEIATLGNQMGVAASELEGFTRAVAMFSATSGIAVDTAATAFGRLRTVAADANFSYMGVADSILKVGVNSVATEEEIINVTTQISSIAASAGFSTQEMIGLSGALASVRVPPELSRSIITRTFGQFDKAIQKNGTELQTLARVSGRSVEDIKKNWGGPGAADIFVDFTEGLRLAGRQARDELTALGITSVRDVPALMRLANAADSTGKQGGLLAQTMADSKNAAGTVQEQYAIMADTVIGRLKVLGNSILSFFDTLGSSSNGFVKSVIDGLTNMFQFMEKIVDNPFSSWALGAMTAVSAIALATSGIAKLVAGVKMFQHVSSIVGGASFMQAIGMTGKAGGTSQLATMTPLLAGTASALNSVKAGASAAGASWGNLFTVLGRAKQEVPPVTGVLGNLVKFGLSPVGIGLATVAGVGVFAYNEWAKGFYEVSTSTDALAKSFTSIDMSNMGEVSKVLRSITISGRDMSVGNFWTQGVQPFGEGLGQMAADLKVFNEYQRLVSQTSTTQTKAQQNYGANLIAKQQGVNADAFKAGLKLLDGTFKEMRSAGNEAVVTDFWKQVSAQADNSTERVEMMKTALTEMPDEAEALTNQFRLQGMTLDQGLAKFGAYSNQMRDLAAEFEGTSIIADSFGLGDQEAAHFGKVMNDAAAAFIDFNAAVEAGTKTDDEGVFTGFSLADFNTSLEDSIKTQDAWMNNIRTLVTKTTPDVIQAMGDLGPAGQQLAQTLVDGLASEDPAVQEQAEKTLATFEEAVLRQKIDFGPNLAEYSNVLEKAGAMLGVDAGVALNAQLAASLQPEDWTALSSGINAVIDKHGNEAGGRLGKRLFEGLNAGTISVDDFSMLSNAFANMGYNASKSLMDALDSGLDMETIRKRIERIQMPKLDASQFTIDDSEKTKITQQFKSMFGAKGIEVPANFSLDTTMGELRTALGQPGLLPDIEAELTLNEVIAKGQLNGFRAWALANGIDVEMTANPNLAYVDVQNFLDHADSQTAWVMLDALKAPAEGSLWEFTTLANGTEVVVQVDAETGKVTGKIYELDTTAAEPVWKEVDANTEVAKTKIAEINALAEADTTSNHTITDNSSTVKSNIDSLQGRNTTSKHTIYESKQTKSAFGNIFQPFAQGGVREDHRPQIAPAGAMRLWAEPETGGEAYIPFAQDRRKRAVGILESVADRFGYSLVRGNNVAQYANGGMYELQSRSRYDRMRNDRMSAATTQREINFTFVNPVERDWAEDAWEKAQMVGARL